MPASQKILDTLARSPIYQQMEREAEESCFVRRTELQLELADARAADRTGDTQRTEVREKAVAKLEKASKALEAAQREFDDASWSREHHHDRFLAVERVIRAQLATLTPDRYTFLRNRIRDAFRAARDKRQSTLETAVVALEAKLDAALNAGAETFERELPTIEASCAQLEREVGIAAELVTTPTSVSGNVMIKQLLEEETRNATRGGSR